MKSASTLETVMRTYVVQNVNMNSVGVQPADFVIQPDVSVFTCLINPASSLARFIPQMWLIPIFAFFLAYLSKNQLIRIFGYVIIMTLLLNNALIAFAYYQYNFEVTRLYRQRLGEMARESKENPMQFYFGHFRTSNILRFEQLGIAFEVVKQKEECNNGQRILPNSIVLKCSPG